MLCRAFENAARRFPITLIYIALFSLWCIIEICTTYHLDRNLESSIWYFTSVGMPLSLAIYIWCEFLQRRSTLPQVIANVLLLVDSIYILSCGLNFSTHWGLSRSALMTALFVAILFVPIKKTWTWNFTVAQLRSIVISVAYSLVAAFAVGIIFLTIYALFDVRNIDKTMFSCMVILSFTLPAVIFLNLVPHKEEVEEREREFHATKLESGTVKYFLLPLTVIYMAILYVYAIEIALTWELPRGGVVWSVTGLAAAVFVTNFFLEGVRRTSPDDSIARFSLRYLPAALLPLMVLMSIAVIYRINQYGLTLSRIYVLTFNVWSYCVLIYYIFCKPKTINYIAISFALVFVATSILPFANYKTLTDDIMRRRLIDTMMNVGIDRLPVDETGFLKTFNQLPDSTQSEIESLVLYLDSYNDHSALDGIIVYDSGKDFPIESLFWNKEVVMAVDIDLSNTDKSITIPKGYTRVKSVSILKKDFTLNSEGATVEIDSVSYSFPLDSLMSFESGKDFEGFYLYPISGNTDSIYISKYFDANADTENPKDASDFNRIYSSGMLFTK